MFSLGIDRAGFRLFASKIILFSERCRTKSFRNRGRRSAGGLISQESGAEGLSFDPSNGSKHCADGHQDAYVAVGQTPDFGLVPRAPEFFDAFDRGEEVVNGLDNQYPFRAGEWFVGKQIEAA